MNIVKRAMVLAGAAIGREAGLNGWERQVTALLACLLSLGAVHAAPIAVQDDAGQTLSLKAPARRVIALAPNLTELLYAAGGGDRLIGAVEYSDFPPAARAAPRVGSNLRLDLERIAALKPDLVLVWSHGNARHETERLAALSIPLFFVEPRHLAEIPGAIERIGQLVGTQASAQAAAARFRVRASALRKQYAERRPVRVFYQVAERPLLTINAQQIISDVITLCGGVNIFADETMLVPQLTTESVVARQPEAILTASLDSHDAHARRALDDPSLQGWRRFGALPAVQHQQLWRLPGDAISRAGPRLLDGADAMCAALEDARKRQ